MWLSLMTFTPDSRDYFNSAGLTGDINSDVS